MSQELLQAIGRAAVEAAFPDGRPYTAISTNRVRRLAERFDIPPRQVEITALESQVVPERYTRNMRTFSLSDQARFLRSHVAVVGLGGLGGGVTELLARAGVGRLTLIDGDRFEDSNLNRQLMSTVALLGSPKADAAAARVAAVNPSVETRAHAVFLDPGNATRLLEGADVVVDCLDSLDSRRNLQRACRRLAVPLVSAAVAGFSGQLTAIFPGDGGFDLIYGPRDPDQPAKGVETSLGTIPSTVTLMSSLEANEAFAILLTGNSALRHHLLVVDLTTYSFERFKLS